MELVIDTNIAFSLLKKDSVTRRLAKQHSLELFSHSFLITELDKYSEVICEKLRVSKDNFGKIKAILLRLVELKKVSPQQLNRAKSIISDPKDSPFLALSMNLGFDLWSNDRHFKEPAVVSVARVFTTSEFVDFLKSKNKP